MTQVKYARRKGLYHYPKKIMPKLARWYYGDLPGVESALCTTRGSGSLGRTEGFQEARGDICPSPDWLRKHADISWVLNVELKHQKNWTWKSIWRDPSKSPLAHFWSQCFRDSRTSDDKNFERFPLLIFTKNYENDYVVMPRQLVDDELLPFANGIEEILGDTWMSLRLSEGAVYVGMLDNFLRNSETAYKIRRVFEEREKEVN